jgi:hypothetical protein
MTLDLGDGNKVLQITALGIHLMFGLPVGGNSPPRPSDNFAEALRTLKDELGVPMNQDIKTDELRKMLVTLVDDKDNDTKAMMVFGLILYNKFICPGYGMRITREAIMVEDFDFAKWKDVNLCQLVVDELRRAIFAWHAAGVDWRAIPGCCIAPLLMYLDCIDHRLVKDIDKRTPLVLFMDPKLLRKVANLDCITKGDERPDSWVYGKLPVSH